MRSLRLFALIAALVGLGTVAPLPAAGALNFTDASTMYVSFGSDAELDLTTVGTFAAIFRTTDVTKDNQFVMGKRVTTGVGMILAVSPGGVGDGAVLANVSRSPGTHLEVSATSVIAEDVWYFGAFTWDTSGADADQKLYLGPLTGPIVEPTYNTQTIGAGTLTDYTAAPLLAGIRDTLATFSRFVGDIAWVGVWNRQLTLEEARAARHGLPPRNGLVLNAQLWHGASASQIDYSAFGNHGTITGALTNAPHPPIAIPFIGGR